MADENRKRTRAVASDQATAKRTRTAADPRVDQLMDIMFSAPDSAAKRRKEIGKWLQRQDRNEYNVYANMWLQSMTPDEYKIAVRSGTFLNRMAAHTGKLWVHCNPTTAQVISISDEEEEDAQLCTICVDRRADTMALPCGHIVVCAQCSDVLAERGGLNARTCVVCRGVVREVLKDT